MTAEWVATWVAVGCVIVGTWLLDRWLTSEHRRRLATIAAREAEARRQYDRIAAECQAEAERARAEYAAAVAAAESGLSSDRPHLPETPETRTTDGEARIRLPAEFANTTVVVERVSDTAVFVRKT